MGVAVVVFGVALVALELAGAPTPTLFAGMIVGGVVTMLLPHAADPPRQLQSIGMAVIGCAAGSSLDAEKLRYVLDEPIVIIGGVLLTLVVTMAIGQLLRLQHGVSRSTAVFASIAGGASGVSIMAKDFGGDTAVVMAVQYLRVIIVLVSVPLIASLLGGTEGGASQPSPPANLAFTATVLALSLLARRWVRFSASDILVPLLLAGTISVSGVFSSTTIPWWVLATGNALVGLAVGSELTGPRIRRIARLLPYAILQGVLSVAACAAVGLVLAVAVGTSPLAGYLATSPGGLPAVVAIALDSGDAVGLVLTMQVMRVFCSLATAPLVGIWLARHPG